MSSNCRDRVESSGSTAMLPMSVTETEMLACNAEASWNEAVNGCYDLETPSYASKIHVRSLAVTLQYPNITAAGSRRCEQPAPSGAAGTAAGC